MQVFFWVTFRLEGAIITRSPQNFNIPFSICAFYLCKRTCGECPCRAPEIFFISQAEASFTNLPSFEPSRVISPLHSLVRKSAQNVEMVVSIASSFWRRGSRIR